MKQSSSVCSFGANRNMAGASSLPLFPPFNVDDEPNSVGPRWKKWLDRLENLFVAMDIDAHKIKKALLLHYAGERVHEIYSTLPTPDEPESDASSSTDQAAVYDLMKEQLTSYFEPKKNQQYEIYVFRSAKQQAGEHLDSYATRLRMLAKNCDFADVDIEIQSQIIQSCTSTRLRRRALRDADMQLTELLDFGRSLETSELQAKGIEKGAQEQVNAVNKTPAKQWKRHQSKGDKSTPSKTSTTCRNCGGAYPHKGGRESCPAHGKECLSCKKKNHFARCCLGKGKMKVNQVEIKESGSSSEDDYVYGVKQNTQSKQPTSNIVICQTKVTVMIDSGASVNILNEATFNKLIVKPNLQKDRAKIYAYGAQSPLPILGSFISEVSSKHKFSSSKFFVVKGSGHVSLLSYQTATELGLIEIINAIPSPIQFKTVADKLVAEYPELFEGIGKLANYQLKLHIDPTVQPKTQPHRRIPFHVRKQVQAELEYLEKQDIIEKIEGPTPWVSLLNPRILKPSGYVLICVLQFKQ